VHHLGRALGTIGRALGETFLHQGSERRRDGGAAPLDQLRLFDHLGGKDLRCRASHERWRPGEHLISHDAERIDVGSVIRVRAGGSLLGRHICRCPEGHP
jgi:hypothetical protein